MKKIILLCFMTLANVVAFAQSPTKLQLIRNATFNLEYNGTKFLFDPMFAPKHQLISIKGVEKSPLVDLPIAKEEILKNTDAVIVTHTHFDHFDDFAVQSLSKNIPLLYQPADKKVLQDKGFNNLIQISDSIDYKGTTIIRTYAQHGTGRALELMGEVSGYILKAKNSPTVYVVGDAVWTKEIYDNIKKYKPNYIIINTGGALIPGLENTPILMDENQAMSLIQESGDAKVIAIHIDAVDHCRTTRVILRSTANENKVPQEKLIIPADGEIIKL